MRRQKRISCYFPSVCRSGDRVNPLGEHRLQGTRIATITASSSMERTVDLASLGPVGEISDGLTLLPLRDSLLVDPVALSESFMGLVIVRVASLCNPGALNAEFWMNSSPNTRRVRDGSSTDLRGGPRQVRSYLNNGHRCRTSACPFCADIVEKVFLGRRTKILRAAHAFCAQRREGPYRFIQNRSRTSVVALKSDAAAEKSKDQFSRDF
jgi:hypothetical protein